MIFFFQGLQRKNVQKKSCRGAIKKRCSEKMQHIYRRTSTRKYDFNKVAKFLNVLIMFLFSMKYLYLLTAKITLGVNNFL